MDLAAVPEISSSYAEKLREAGVPHAEALAVWPDLPPLAERADIDLDRLEGYRDAARARIERALAEAGVAAPGDLAVAELAPLAERTGIDVEYLRHYQTKAREALGRIVLAADAPLARVELRDRTHDAVQVLPFLPGDTEEQVLARATGDAVVLRPGSEVAGALIGGVAHRALPLYKERRRGEGQVDELRVRVVEIREAQAAPAEKKSGIGKLFSRKK